MKNIERSIEHGFLRLVLQTRNIKIHWSSKTFSACEKLLNSLLF